MKITQKLLKKLYTYNPKDGLFRWRVNGGRWGKRKPGSVAGCISKVDGYGRMTIKGKVYTTHRLVFLYMIGRFPKKHTDHINGNKSDNRWENLREATPTQNNFNSRLSERNTSGYKGVTYDKHNSGKRKWKAQIRIDGISHHIGTFLTPKDGHEAYKKKLKEIAKEFANFG